VINDKELRKEAFFKTYIVKSNMEFKPCNMHLQEHSNQWTLPIKNNCNENEQEMKPQYMNPWKLETPKI
jgi:hypothetical protein